MYMYIYIYIPLIMYDGWTPQLSWSRRDVDIPYYRNDLVVTVIVMILLASKYITSE